MKCLVLVFALASASAFACPDAASSKDAMAPAMSKPQIASKATPISLAKNSAAPTPAKSAEKIAAKTPEQRRTAPL
jgi:hypothetical protein